MWMEFLEISSEKQKPVLELSAGLRHAEVWRKMVGRERGPNIVTQNDRQVRHADMQETPTWGIRYFATND